jgi:hypothetical protein
MVANGERVCQMGMCTSRCNAGTERVGATCEVLAPRLIAPMSTSFVTTHRPTLRWQLPMGLDGARVEICSTRTCGAGEIEQSFDAMGSSVRPTMALTPGVHWWRVKGRLMGSTGTRTSATWEFFVRQRDTPVDTSWGSVLDVNGDGFADVATGSADPDIMLRTEPTSVRVYLGSAMGIVEMPSVFSSPTDESNFGRAVSSAGDVNGDGFADLIVGAPGVADGPMLRVGKAFVFLGSMQGLAARPSWEMRGATQDEQFGRAATFIGDLNGDGYGDIAIGAPEFAPGAGGTLNIFFGSPSGPQLAPAQTIRGIDPDEKLGVTVRSAGDFNGDSIPDLISASRNFNVGVRTVASIYLGTRNGFALPPHRRFVRTDGDSGLGLHSTNAGDTNGDGYNDILLSSPNNYAHVYHGSPAGISSMPDRVLATGGQAVGATSGDLNQDGFDDVVVGLPLQRGPMPIGNEMGGFAWFVGALDGTRLTPNMVVFATEGTLGHTVSIVGDIDHDGAVELLVRYSNPLAPDSARRKGLKMFRGAVNGPAFSRDIVGPADDAAFGSAVNFCQ